jgi:hypothetical protein
VFVTILITRKAFKHQVNHRQINQVFTGFWQILIVFTQAPTFAQPSKSAFHNPAFGLDGETFLLRVLFDNFNPNPENLLSPMNQGWAVITTVQEKELPTLKERDTAQKLWQSNFILPVGWVNFNPY